jgi:hypothetical protein
MISGQRPGDEQNGLDEIADELLAPNSEDVVVVAVMRVTKIVDAVEKGDRYPVVRIARIEPLEGEAVDVAQKLLQEAYAQRTGNEALDLGDLDDAEEAAE